MSRWRSRQARRRRRLLLLGSAAALAAGVFWYRSLHDAYPWSADRTAKVASPAILAAGEQQALAANEPEPPEADASPATQPGDSISFDEPLTGTQSHAAVVETELPKPVAATRPTGFQPARPDRAAAAREADAGITALEKGDRIKARDRLSKAYEAGLAPSRQAAVREKMAELAAETLFSGKWFKDDPLTERVLVQSGETLGGIAGRYHIPQDFVAAINRIQQRNLIRQGQRLKVVHGPFHAVVSKREHLLDLYVQNVYVRSFRVALGIDGSTPAGTWRVATRQEDPGWADPRTGQRWHPSDPNNPIGEYWIGLVGVEGDALGQTGYGIHGTIEPESIGKDVSMGCIRMAPDDIALLFKLLLPGESYVVIVD